MQRVILSLVSSLALAGVLAGCAASMDAPPPSGCMTGERGVTVQLFFGRGIAGAVPVSDAAWQAFVDGVVTPNFLDGFTVLDAQGQWRNRETGQIVREPAKVIVIAAPRDAQLGARIDAITTAYKQRFAQQSVGVVTTPSCAAF